MNRLPDPDPADRVQHVLQAEELQDCGVVRQAAARAGAQARGGAADQEDTAGKDDDDIWGNN